LELQSLDRWFNSPSVVIKWLFLPFKMGDCQRLRTGEPSRYIQLQVQLNLPSVWFRQIEFRPV